MTKHHAPYFLPEPPGTGGGVDYLGMRAINLMMMDRLFTGLNNVAGSIRPFALMAWTIWHYRKTCTEAGAALSSSEYRKFREKIETLYIWSHQEVQLHSGIPGAGQRSVGGGAVHLAFDTFARGENNTFLAAINYGPALKGASGIGFAVTVADGLFDVTAAGLELARAFDCALRAGLSDTQYRFLASLTDMVIDAVNVKHYVDAWRITTPSKAEQQVFLTYLYQPNQSGQATSAGLRTDAINLALSTLEATGRPMTLNQLRQAMAVPAAYTYETTGPMPLREVRIRWQVLLVRQAQRLATEALFGWLERSIWDNGARSTAEVGALMTDAIRSIKPDTTIDNLLAELVSTYQVVSNANQMFALSLTNPDLDVVQRAVNLEAKAAARKKDDAVPADAFDLLALCAVYAEHFDNDPDAKKVAAEGSAHRLPLAWWARTVRLNTTKPFSLFLETFIETWLVSQHLAVAASRFDDDNGRMRLSIEDGGLVSVLSARKDCWSPQLSADRLGTALSLLNQCGVITINPGDKRNATTYALADKLINTDVHPAVATA